MDFLKEFSTEFLTRKMEKSKVKISNLKFEDDWNYKGKITASFNECDYGFTIRKYENLYEIYLNCSTFEDLDLFYDCISLAKFNDKIISLSISQPEREVVNGICNYNLENLLQVEFKNCEALLLQQFNGFTALPSIGNSWDNDEGFCDKILKSMPNLKHLALPNSPSLSFFYRQSHPLKKMDIQLYFLDKQNFISNLTKSDCFKNLEFLRITETLGERYGGENISNEEYLNFFENCNFQNLRIVELRNVTFQKDFINKLKRTKLGKNLDNLLCTKAYVNNDVYIIQQNLENNEILQTMWQDNNDWKNQKYPI
jgi:hypothetical protein